jgi:hypothetical protein
MTLMPFYTKLSELIGERATIEYDNRSQQDYLAHRFVYTKNGGDNGVF